MPILSTPDIFLRHLGVVALALSVSCAKPAVMGERSWLELSSEQRMERLAARLDTDIRLVRLEQSTVRFVDISPQLVGDPHEMMDRRVDGGVAPETDGGVAPETDGGVAPEGNGASPAQQPRADTPIPWLFVHGINGTIGDFGDVIIEASKSRRVLALNLPGHGGSVSLDDDYSIDAYIRAIREFLKKAGVEQVDLVCHSLGGQVCTAMGLNDFSFIRSITLIDTAGIIDHDEFVRKLGHNYGGINLGTLVTNTDRSLPYASTGDREFFTRFLSDNPKLLSALESFTTNYRHKVRHMAKPTLILWGKDDAVFGVDNAFMLHQNISGSQLHILDGAGHCPQLSDAEKVIKWIQQFQDALPD